MGASGRFRRLITLIFLIPLLSNSLSAPRPAVAVESSLAPASAVSDSNPRSTISIDDSVQGSGPNQFNYAPGLWQHCTNCGSALYNAS